MSNTGRVVRTRAVRRVIYRYIWDRLRVSYWFAPVVMSLIAILLSWVMLWVDDRIPNEVLENSHIILSGSVDQVRSSLLNIATTVLATAGIVFTLLTLPLSTVVAQYGSRLLRVFLGDRITQYVLGMFVATFVYCIAAATSIPPEEINPDGAQVTATFGLLLMLGTFGSLILLVQHISIMLQAPNIAAAAGTELMDAILAGASDEVGNGGSQGQTGSGAYIAEDGEDCHEVELNKAGYIEYIDLESLLTLAEEKDLVIRLLYKPGDFVPNSATVAQVWPAIRINEQLDRLIRRAFQVGIQRMPTQDVVYAFKQLVEMAVRAMSPAINDPFTAITCLDYIGDGLILFVQQDQSSPAIYGRDGKCRIVFEPVTFDKLLDTSFNMLRHASCDNASVLQRMLKVIDVIGQETKSPEMRRKLAYHVSLIRAERKAGSLIEEDQKLIDRECAALQRKLRRAI